MLVLIAVSAVPFGWVASQVNWILQRHEVLRRAQGYTAYFAEEVAPFEPNVKPEQSPQAPGLLWLFGEEGQYSIRFLVGSEHYLLGNLSEDEQRSIEHAKKLFPEAIVQWTDSREWCKFQKERRAFYQKVRRRSGK